MLYLVASAAPDSGCNDADPPTTRGPILAGRRSTKALRPNRVDPSGGYSDPSSGAPMSYVEILCKKVLRDILKEDITIQGPVRPDFLRNWKTGRNLELDIFLPELNLAFEIQGQHHFDDLKQIERDAIKLSLACENGVDLLYLGVTQISHSNLFRKLSHCSAYSPSLRPWDSLWLKSSLSQDVKEHKALLRSKYSGQESLSNPKVWLIHKEKNAILDSVRIGDLVHYKTSKGERSGIVKEIGKKIVVELKSGAIHEVRWRNLL
jgi:hypothetical protein